jgi:hypothetical protein
MLLSVLYMFSAKFSILKSLLRICLGISELRTRAIEHIEKRQHQHDTDFKF